MHNPYRREDPNDMELKAPTPPEAAYGEWVHCPQCSSRLTHLDPDDPWCQCNMCGQVADIRSYLKPKPEPQPA